MKFIPGGMPNDNDADDQGPPRRMAPSMPMRHAAASARGGKKGGGLAALRKLVMMHQPRRGAAQRAY